MIILCWWCSSTLFIVMIIFQIPPRFLLPCRIKSFIWVLLILLLHYHLNVKHKRCCAVLILGSLSLIIILYVCVYANCLNMYDFVFIVMCIHLFLQWDLLLYVDWRGRQQEVWVLQTPAGKPLLNPSSSAPWSHPAEPCLLWQICDMWKRDMVFLWGQWCVVWLATVAAGKRIYKAKNGHGLCQEHQ